MVVKVQGLAWKPQRAGTWWKTPGCDSPSSLALISEVTSPPKVLSFQPGVSGKRGLSPVLHIPSLRPVPGKEMVLEGDRGKGERGRGKEEGQGAGGGEMRSGCEPLSPFPCPREQLSPALEGSSWDHAHWEGTGLETVGS